MACIKSYKQYGWKCLAGNGGGGNPDDYRNGGRMIVSYANRAVMRFDGAGGKAVYAKWFFPQSESFIKVALNWLKRIFRGPRVRHVFRIHCAMKENGIGCGEPVLAAWRLSGMTELFVCTEVEAPQVSTLLANEDEAECRRVLVLAAAGMRELHAAGFIHGDAIPGNICLEGNGRVYWLDNDRTGRCSSRKQALRNVVQFCSRLFRYSRLPDAADIFMHEYCGNDFSAGDVEKLRCRVGERIAEVQKEIAQKASRTKQS